MKTLLQGVQLLLMLPLLGVVGGMELGTIALGTGVIWSIVITGVIAGLGVVAR